MLASMSKPQDYDRRVPAYPEIREEGITPVGFGIRDGNKPCFCTEFNRCYLYIPHDLISDQALALRLIDLFLPELETIWQAPRDLAPVTTEVSGRKRQFYGFFCFSHILIEDWPPNG